MGRRNPPHIGKEANMAEKKITTETESREDIFIPRGMSNEDPNLFVSVNGKNFLLPKGKTSNVPSYIAAEIRRAYAAQAHGDEKNDELLAKAQEPMYRI